MRECSRGSRAPVVATTAVEPKASSAVTMATEWRTNCLTINFCLLFKDTNGSNDQYYCRRHGMNGPLLALFDPLRPYRYSPIDLVPFTVAPGHRCTALPRATTCKWSSSWWSTAPASSPPRSQTRKQLLRSAKKTRKASTAVPNIFTVREIAV